MMKIFLITVSVLFLSLTAFGQGELNSKGQPVAKNEQNAPVTLKYGVMFNRGADLVKGTK